MTRLKTAPGGIHSEPSGGWRDEMQAANQPIGVC